MSWFSAITGADAVKRQGRGVQQTAGQYDTAMQDEMSGTGWEDAFNKTAGAQLAGALPGLRSGLQMTREDAIRRGISTGDLGSSLEGDFVGNWEKNIANSFAGQASNQYNASRGRYLDLLTGKMDRQQAELNAARKRRGSIYGGVGSLIGAGIGGAYGGTAGAAAGGRIGGAVLGGGY